MLNRLLMTAVLAALPLSAIAADAAAAPKEPAKEAPSKEIKAVASPAPKVETKADAKAEAALHPKWTDTKIDLRHCLKHDSNKAVISCAN